MKSAFIKTILFSILITPSGNARTITGPVKRPRRPVRKNALQSSKQSRLRIEQLKKVMRNSHSTILQSAKKDLAEPLMKELSLTIEKKLSNAPKINLKSTGKKSSFILAPILKALETQAPKELQKWNQISAAKKQELFTGATQQVLSHDTQAIKKALSLIFSSDLALQKFIAKITSFTDQKYLKELFSGPEAALAKRLFEVSNNRISLIPSLVNQLTTTNLPVATVPILRSIAHQYTTLSEYEIIIDKPWMPMTLWLGTDTLASHLQDHVLLRIYTLYELRSWFKSPGIAEKRFTPWYFLLTPIDKPFPAKGAPFTIKHLNSAALLSQGTVYFRDEELLKNIVHELLHGFKLENGIDKESASTDLKKRYAITQLHNGPLLLAEALIEGLTHIVHTMYLAAEHTGGTFESRLQNLWSLEKTFAFYQSAKMLYVSGFSSVKEFMDPSSKARVRQTTPAAEYHLLKTALISTPEKLLEIAKHPQNKQKKLLNLIDANMKDPTFIKEMDRLLDWIKKHQGPAPLFTTGRMTLSD